MSKNQLGEFEEVVMLTVAILTDDAYGYQIAKEIETRIGRKVSIGSLQTVLIRLEKKGFLKSCLGETSNVRGGKRKRYYELSETGKAILRTTKEQRMALWNSIPDIVFNS